MTEFFFQDVWRMDWGLGNPNKTAALIATAMVGVWVAAWWGRWGYWFALVSFTALGVCLVHTFSRGGLVGVMGGLSVLVFSWQFSGGRGLRGVGRVRLIGVLVSGWIILGWMFSLEAHKRYGQGVMAEDRSVLNRLEVWAVTPKMMVDAPGGWGLGKSGSAYMEWYQALDRVETYRTMVNSHLTWLVELGWLGRFGYLFAWVFLLALCLPVAWRRQEGTAEGRRYPAWFAAVLGVWVTFGVCAVFSSVAEEWVLWIIPLGALLAVIVARLRCKCLPSLRTAGGCAGLSFVTCGILFTAGLWTEGDEIRKADGLVVFGGSQPDVVVLGDEEILGVRPGRLLRMWVADNPERHMVMAVGQGGDFKRREGVAYLLAGKVPEDSKDWLAASAHEPAGLVALLNPVDHPMELGLDEASGIRVIAGAFSGQRNLGAWRRVTEVREVEGAGTYVATWPQIANELVAGRQGGFASEDAP